MTDQAIDAALKRRVLGALLVRERADLRANTVDVGDEHTAAEVINDDTVTFDDRAQSSEELGIAAPLEAAAAQQAADLQRIEELDPAPVDRVGIGTLVGFDGDWFVTGVVAAPFEVDGVTYEGLSADAPLYSVIAGLRAGDAFTFRDRQHRIDSVV